MIVRASFAAVLLLAACQSPDVGQRCTLGGENPLDVTPQTAQGDYLENGNVGCDSLICIVSPVPAGARYGDVVGSNNGYCSKPCVSNQDCFPSKTGLECRQMVLDEAFIASLDPAVRDRYLGAVGQFSSYCAVPLPP